MVCQSVSLNVFNIQWVKIYSKNRIYQNLFFGGPPVNVAHGHMKMHEDTDRHPTDLKSARMNYPNSTMQPFVLQNASVDFQYPKPALS